MPARTSSWPSGWPSFNPSDNDPSDSYQRNLKAAIIAEYGADNLRTAWVKTCHALQDVTSQLAAAGSKAVPIFSYDDVVSSNNMTVLAAMKAAGCFIIRNVIPKDEAEQHFQDLQAFIADNRDIVTGWPAKSIAIYHLYSSPVQLKLRTHAHHLKLQRVLNSLYTDTTVSGSEQQAQYDPVLYPDALRIRAPGQDFYGLGPHIDAGSLVRWADDEYRKTYEKIFQGTPEAYDPYDMTHRKSANPGLFPGGAHCSVLRTFQGWTALTPCVPGGGGLMLVPDIKVATAYFVLRPFFTAPEDGDHWKDPERWVIDEETGWFPGTYRWDSQLLSPESHPHLYLEDTLVSIPEMLPGDTVWWHADVGFSPCSYTYLLRAE